MKPTTRTIRLLIITLAAPACMLAGESGVAKPSVMQESLALLKKTILYQPTLSHETAETNEPSDEIVKMERFVVAESYMLRELSEKIERESEKKRIEQFSIIKGGTIYKLGPLAIGTWGDRSGFGFLKMSW